MKDWTDEGGRRTASPPPSQDGPVALPPPARPGVAERRLRELTEQVEAIRRQLSGAEVTTELDAVVSGLEPDQEIRAAALAAAVRALPRRDEYADLPDEALPAAVLRLAEGFADYITGGSKP